MSTAIEMTDEEKTKILDAYDEALDRGDRAAARKIIRKLPIPQPLVPWVRECFSETQIREMKLVMPEPERQS